RPSTALSRPVEVAASLQADFRPNVSEPSFQGCSADDELWCSREAAPLSIRPRPAALVIPIHGFVSRRLGVFIVSLRGSPWRTHLSPLQFLFPMPRPASLKPSWTNSEIPPSPLSGTRCATAAFIS